ncbi:hypothetical protein SATMO3_28580 [Sporomusa aerivorans]
MFRTAVIESALVWFLFGSLFLCRAVTLIATWQQNSKA